VHLDPVVNSWQLAPVARLRGGRQLARREAAPLGRTLPYRRAAGQAPPDGERRPHSDSWSADLGLRGLGDLLLGLGLVQALADATGDEAELTYRGPRTALMERCTLPLSTEHRSGGNRVVHRNGGQRWTAVPEQPPVWLDQLDEELFEVHAPLAMRYYLAVEQRLGIRLPAERDPLPRFTSTERQRPGHVVFVAATSRPDRKDYGLSGFIQVAGAVAEHAPAPCTFTVVTGADETPCGAAGLEFVAGLEAADCVDVFATAELVVGNDTGLTHLAALTRGPSGDSPEVIGLYGRHSAAKWTTGGSNHHSMATMFSQMLTASDRCPVRDNLDDGDWGEAALLDRIGPHQVADFAAELLGWSTP
jgi:hypothetical protein